MLDAATSSMKVYAWFMSAVGMNGRAISCQHTGITSLLSLFLLFQAEELCLASYDLRKVDVTPMKNSSRDLV